jgi:uncharacterized RDD family membrane protein YckC
MNNLTPDPDYLTAGVMSRRVMAWLLDMIVLAIVLAIAWVGCLAFGILTLGFGWGIFMLIPVLPFAYTICSLASGLAATPGQLLMGLRAVREEDLGPPGFARALVFAIGFALTLSTSGLLLLVALFTPGHRTLHDMVSGLAIVRGSRLAPLTATAGGWNMPGASWPR